MERGIHDSTPVQSRVTTEEICEEAKRCPFMTCDLNHCNPACAMHTAKGCAIVLGEKPVLDGKCPFGNGAYAMTCDENCTFYAEGCAMIKRKG